MEQGKYKLKPEDKYIIGVIKKYEAINGCSPFESARLMHMSPATYYNRLGKPSNFTMGEFRRFLQHHNVPESEAMEILGYAG